MFASPSLFAKKDGDVFFGSDEVCQGYLTNPRYGVTRVFDKRDPIWSLRAEVDSIEAIQQGTVAELTSIRYFFRTDTAYLGNGPAGVSRLVQGIELARRRLMDIKMRRPERRLSGNIEQVLRRLDDQQRDVGDEPLRKTARIVTATLFELMMSCFFAGDEIYLGYRVSQLFPAEYERDKGTQRKGWDREIDVAIENKDGSWRWIEVKDWSQGESMSQDGRTTVMEQGRGQNQARRMLTGKKVGMTLILRYGIPANQLAYYKNSHYDQVYLAYPEGPYRPK